MSNAQDEAFIQSTKGLFRSRNRAEVGAYVFGALAFIGYIASESNVMFLLFLVSIVAWFISCARLFTFSEGIEEAVWDKFSASYSISRTSLEAHMRPAFEGALGRVGVYQAFSPKFAGILDSYSLVVYKGDIYFGKQSQDLSDSKEYRVLEITTKQNFANIYLDGKITNHRFWRQDAISVLRGSLAGNRKLTAEGDFNTYFDIYVPNDVPEHMQSESLITLTPDKMLALRDYGRQFDVEFTGNKIYIITRGRIKNAEDILAYQGSIFGLIEQIGANLTRNYEFSGAQLETRGP